jgi:hypothetical protein
MTTAELEQIATKIRATGLHSSWSELIEFSNDVVGDLVEAYQTMLKDPASSNGDNTEKMYLLVRDRLSKALISLTSPEYVAKWESEVLGSSITTPATAGTSIYDTK